MGHTRIVVTLFALAVALTTLSGCDRKWEASILERSGLEIERHEVIRTYSDSVSHSFGSEARYRLVFRLPDGYSGLENCGVNGYPDISLFGFDEAGIDEQDSCTRRVMTDSGTVYTFTLFEDQIFVTVLT